MSNDRKQIDLIKDVLVAIDKLEMYHVMLPLPTAKLINEAYDQLAAYYGKSIAELIEASKEKNNG